MVDTLVILMAKAMLFMYGRKYEPEEQNRIRSEKVVLNPNQAG